MVHLLSRILALISLLALVVFDSRHHFDNALVELKRTHRSAQRHWSIFYPQGYTWQDSALRYHRDLAKIAEIVEPRSVVLSDLATSYYLAAYSPLYIRNTHTHHFGRAQWKQLLGPRGLCSGDIAAAVAKLRQEFERANVRLSENSSATIDYVVLNKDSNNINLRYDCITRSGAIESIVGDMANLLYAGEFLYLYEIKH